MVIDGKVGFTGGYNLADEYFNITHPYGYWKDTGVKLTGRAVQNFTMMFLEMWNVMGKADTDYEKYLKASQEGAEDGNVQKASGYVQPYADSPLDGEPVGENVYLNLIKTAKKRLYVATPYLIISDDDDERAGTGGKNVAWMYGYLPQVFRIKNHLRCDQILLFRTGASGRAGL